MPEHASHPDALDLRRTGICALLLAPDRFGEQLLLREGARSIRVNVRSGTLGAGPVRLRYALEGLVQLEPQLLTLRRLAALWRLGRMPAQLFPPERQGHRWVEVLRTADALAEGASFRDIAGALYGDALTRAEWRGQSDFLRLRVQRLARKAVALVERDYLDLIR